MAAPGSGQDLVWENISNVVTGFALQEYMFKQLTMMTSSSSEEEIYFAETSTELTGGTGSAIEGIPKNAQFPFLEPTWTRKKGRMKKHGGETWISWETKKTANIDIMARSLLRIARAIAKSVDDEILI